MLFKKGTHKHYEINGYGIITMAGKSERFFNEGYTVQKYKLPAKQKTVFHWAVKSCFPFYSHGYKLIFVICKQNGDDASFIKEHIEELQITNYSILEIEDYTDGQATTAFKALDLIDKNKPIFVYNIDTALEQESLNNTYELSKQGLDGIIPCSSLEGDMWSFIKEEHNKIIDIKEKTRISNNATLGFYWFKSAFIYEHYFNQTFCTFINKVNPIQSEKYISHMYKKMIKDGLNIQISDIEKEKVSLFGTPEQYLHYRNFF